MSDISTFGSIPSPAISPLTTQADKVLRHPGSKRRRRTARSRSRRKTLSPFSWEAGCSRRSRALAACPGETTMATPMPARSSFREWPCSRWAIR